MVTHDNAQLLGLSGHAIPTPENWESSKRVHWQTCCWSPEIRSTTSICSAIPKLISPLIVKDGQVYKNTLQDSSIG